MVLRLLRPGVSEPEGVGGGSVLDCGMSSSLTESRSVVSCVCMCSYRAGGHMGHVVL